VAETVSVFRIDAAQASVQAMLAAHQPPAAAAPVARRPAAPARATVKLAPAATEADWAEF